MFEIQSMVGFQRSEQRSKKRSLGCSGARIKSPKMGLPWGAAKRQQVASLQDIIGTEMTF